MASPSIFRDLIERLSQEHEALLSQYNELLSRHRSAQNGGDDANLSDQLPSAVWRPPPAQPRRPPETNVVDAGLLGHGRSKRVATLAALASAEDIGEAVDEVALDASASLISDEAAVAGPRQKFSSMPSVREDCPVDLNLVETDSCLASTESSGLASTQSTLREKLHPEWSLSHEELKVVVARRNTMDPQDVEDVSGSMAAIHRCKLYEPSKRTSGCQRLMVEPNCARKLCWDLIGMACLCWDVCVIPLFVFDIEEASFTMAFGIAIACFWTSDTVFTFFVGFYDNGRVEMSPRKIWIRYIKSWFFPDVALLTLDWTVIFLEFVSVSSDAYFNFLRIGRTWRFVRFVRVLRLLRIIKANHMLEELHDLIRSEVMQTVMTIVKLLLGVAIINHILACAWYGIGSSGPEEANWVHYLRVTGATEESSDTMYHYLSSLHWSLTQFTPASMDVVPHNKWERLFAICTILLALVVFSSFLSSITGAMTQLKALKMKEAKTQIAIRRFSIDNHISSELALQVHRFARMHQRKSTRVLVADLHFVKLLPESLRIRLHSEVFLPRLSKHPMFERWLHVDLPGLIKVCHTAMDEMSLLGGEEVFNVGDQCGMMYLALSGNLRYLYYDHANEGDAIIEIVGKETEQKRISEMALWTPWDHKGRLFTTSPSLLFTLNSARFRGVVKARSAFVGPATSYARSYLSEIVQAFHGRKELLLDVWGEADVLDRLAYDAFQDMDIGMSRPLDKMSTRRMLGMMGSSLTKLLHVRKDNY